MAFASGILEVAGVGVDGDTGARTDPEGPGAGAACPVMGALATLPPPPQPASIKASTSANKEPGGENCRVEI